MCLARLRNVEVVELLSTVIEHLVKGEVMQLHGIIGKNDVDAFEVGHLPLCPSFSHLTLSAPPVLHAQKLL